MEAWPLSSPCWATAGNARSPCSYLLVFTNGVFLVLLYVATSITRRIMAMDWVFLRWIPLHLLHRRSPGFLFQISWHHRFHSSVDRFQHRLYHRAKISGREMVAIRKACHGEHIFGLPNRIGLRKY